MKVYFGTPYISSLINLMMLNAKVLKWMDLLVQFLIIGISFFYLFIDFATSFKVFFFGLGFWQLGSFLTDLYLRRKLHLSHSTRRKYSLQLLIALFMSVIAFSIYKITPLLSIFLLFIFILYSMALACYYLIISYRELKIIDEQSDRNDLLDINN